MKKTGYVWFLLVCALLELIGTVITFILAIVSLSFVSLNHEGVGFVLVESLITIILLAIYIYQSIKFRPSLIFWTHVIFGFYSLTVLIDILTLTKVIPAISSVSQTLNSTTITFPIIELLLLALVWSTFVKHIKRVFSKSSTPAAAI